jgi:hypothetical protein
MIEVGVMIIGLTTGEDPNMKVANNSVRGPETEIKRNNADTRMIGGIRTKTKEIGDEMTNTPEREGRMSPGSGGKTAAVVTITGRKTATGTRK